MYQAWRRTRGYFWLAAGLFALGVISGAALAGDPRMSKELFVLIGRKFGPMTERIRHGGPLVGVMIILFNNLLAALLTLILGFTLFFPALTAYGNGLIVGLVAASAHQAYGLTLPRFLAMLLPHGFLELPALFLASALAWRWGVAFWRRTLGKSGEETRQLAGDLKRLGRVLLALFAAASFLEVFVSGAFAPKF